MEFLLYIEESLNPLTYREILGASPEQRSQRYFAETHFRGTPLDIILQARVWLPAVVAGREAHVASSADADATLNVPSETRTRS